MNFEKWFMEHYAHIPLSSAIAVLELVKEQATVPFIARYRKEKTGNLNEVDIQAVIDAQQMWTDIVQRQSFIIQQIEKQNKLTEELKNKILSTYSLVILEDLYLPFKQKKKTKATVAKEMGLEPLAQWIWDVGHSKERPSITLEEQCKSFINETVKDGNAAIEGALAILVERLSEMQHLRQMVRKSLFQWGVIQTLKSEDAKEHNKFERYFQYEETIASLMQPENSHRYLAIKRGWNEKQLQLKIIGQVEGKNLIEFCIAAFEKEACIDSTLPVAPILYQAAHLACKAYVLPSIELEIHKSLKEIADQAAILVFSENVRKLLLAPPLGAKAVLGVDPGLRTGCKLAVVDSAGQYLASHVIYLHTEEQKQQAQEVLFKILETLDIKAIAIGNGTGSKEVEGFIRSALKQQYPRIDVVMVNEAGASIYSTSEIAREEFPHLDATVRGAISIARRLQDPLAELVKIDPKSIGVGQYQHDVNQLQLKKSLIQTIQSCVNHVGVNVNTASARLLSYVSGIGESLAKAMVGFRHAKGLFLSRDQFLEIPYFSKKTFEQAAGFLRVPNGTNPLDNTAVHPEKYAIIEVMASVLDRQVIQLTGKGAQVLKQDPSLRDKIGSYTFDDILEELEKPGRDIRDVFVPVVFRQDIAKIEDLKPGFICPGIVTNVTNFGAFVDIGVHQDGLLHVSEFGKAFVKDPKKFLSPGDAIKVRVLEINLEKRHIMLSLKLQDQKEIRKPNSPVQPKHAAKITSTNFHNPFEALLRGKKGKS